MTGPSRGIRNALGKLSSRHDEGDKFKSRFTHIFSYSRHHHLFVRFLRMTMVTTLLFVDDLKRHIFTLASHTFPNKTAVVAVGALLSWLCYRTLRRVAVKSLVRGLPGPYNPSWLTGELVISTISRSNLTNSSTRRLIGNFPEIYDVLNVRWHHEAVGKYGKLFQISGMLGVSVHIYYIFRMSSSPFSQLILFIF